MRFEKRDNRQKSNLLQYGIFIEVVFVLILLAAITRQEETVSVNLRIEDHSTSPGQEAEGSNAFEQENDSGTKEPIKWIDFNVSYDALCLSYEWDVRTHGKAHEVNWIDLLAYTAAKTGGVFEQKALAILDEAARKLSDGEVTIEELTEDMKYYS